MIRKLSWILLFVAAYFWITTSEEKIDIYTNAKTVYEYTKKKWEELGFEVHIHTLECLKQEKRKTN